MNLITPLFIIPIITGPILVIAGFILFKKPPKKINQLYGYRTRLAMKSQEHWEFAQTFSARRMIIWGFFYTTTCLMPLFIQLDEKLEIGLAFILMLVFILIPVFETQNKLKKKFEHHQ